MWVSRVLTVLFYIIWKNETFIKVGDFFAEELPITTHTHKKDPHINSLKAKISPDF